jgi:hypothetical protein
VGRLADRHGLARLIILVLVARAAAYGSLAAADEYAHYLAAVVVGLAGDQVTPSLQQALVGRLVAGNNRGRLLGMLRAVRNVGLSVGLAVGGVALASGSATAVRGALLFNGLSYLAMAIGYRYITTIARINVAGRASQSGAPTQRLPYLKMIALASANGALLFHDTLLFVFLPLWVVRVDGLQPSAVAVAMLVNTTLSVVLQLWIPRGRHGEGWRSGMVVATTALVGSVLVFQVAEWAPTEAIWALGCLAVVMLTIGENFHGVAAWNLSYAVSPEGRAAEYLSVFSLGNAVQGIIGPLVATLVMLPILPLGWLVGGVVFAVGPGGLFWFAPGLEDAAAESPQLK